MPVDFLLLMLIFVVCCVIAGLGIFFEWRERGRRD